MPEASRIAVTGAAGLIGRHVQCHLRGEPGISVLAADRTLFSSQPRLKDLVSKSDAVVHLAGMNRGNDGEIERTNVQLAESLISALDAAGNRPHLLFASSAHITRDTPYARSKRAAAELFRAWAARVGAKCTTLVLPHVFGEGGRPFYNSAVSTFCHQLSANEVPKIIQDGNLELLHAQRVSETVLQLIRDGTTGDISLPGVPTTVTELLKTLQDMSAQYRGFVIPDLRSPLRLDLFNTLRSYMFPKEYPTQLILRTDPRGALFEAVKSDNGGQSFISTTRPGITRGNHYHRRKVERFLVIQGEASIRIRHILSKEVVEFLVDGATPRFVDIPTLHTHDITNKGQNDLLTLFWSHEIFNPDSPDTFPEPV